LHRKDLPGRPDIVLPKYRTVIFVHGCFWHRHQGCREGGYFPKNPSQGIKFWREKFRKNVETDKRNYQGLSELGWKVIVIWECETKNAEELKENLELYSGCISGAATIDELKSMLENAGFINIQITPDEKSRNFLESNLKGTGIESKVVSASIEAVKP